MSHEHLFINGVNMKYIKIFEGRRMWAWFILLSILISLLVAMFSGSLQIKRNIHAGAPLEIFQVHMEERIHTLMKLYQIPGCSIALVHDYEIAWTQGFGYADVESGRALTADTAMSVQSITKSLTAWGVMKLAEKGLIDVDAPLSSYLMSWQFPHTDYSIEKVTVRRLLNHTAGIPLGDFGDIYAPGAEMPSLREKLTREAILLYEPGTRFSYSNVGYHLLELLIEEVTGEKFAEYMYSEVLLPLSMEMSTFDVGNDMIPYPPTGYNLGGKPVPVYLYPQKASGGLFATAEDIARFVVASMNENPVLSDESVKMLHTPQTRKIGIYSLVFDAYGFGHYIETIPNDLYSISHGGQGNGIMTHFQAIPETGDAIVILTNSQRSWPFIAYLLSDWGQWLSLSQVGMERIIWAHYGLSAVIGMLLSMSLLIILRMIVAFYVQKQIGYRFFWVGISAILLGILFWCASQEYLLISSVFPVLSVWLGSTVLVFSIALLLPTLLFHITKKRCYNSERVIGD